MAGRNQIRVIYFVPNGREPEPEYESRLDRVMTHIQEFYRAQMMANDFGDMTFPVERDGNGRLTIHVVRGTRNIDEYHRNSPRVCDRLKLEINRACSDSGITVDGRGNWTVVFQALLKRQGVITQEIGPFCALGEADWGNAWIFDDERLDPELLSSKEPGGYFDGSSCSLGKFNTMYIGGAAHEIGHVLSLPENGERPIERLQRGVSIMGGGNHHYGEELRSEGRGVFLTRASALPLATHALFTGKSPHTSRWTCVPETLTTESFFGELRIRGKFETSNRPAAIIAYSAQEHKTAYEDVGWTSDVQSDGRFELAIADLEAGRYRLRLTAIGEKGRHDFKQSTFSVDADACAFKIHPSEGKVFENVLGDS